MGEGTKVTAFRFKLWVLVMLDAIQVAFSPLIRSRTHAAEVAIWAFWEARFTGRTLADILSDMQRLLCYARKTQQLSLAFPNDTPFYPKIWHARDEVAMTELQHAGVSE